MTPEQLVAVITATLAPLSVMFGAWLRERAKARIARRRQTAALESIEALCHGLEAVLEDLSQRTARIEGRLGLVPQPEPPPRPIPMRPRMRSRPDLG